MSRNEQWLSQVLDIIIHLYFCRVDDTKRAEKVPGTPALGTPTKHTRAPQVVTMERREGIVDGRERTLGASPWHGLYPIHVRIQR